MKCPEDASLETERLVAPKAAGRVRWGISLCSDECVLESENPWPSHNAGNVVKATGMGELSGM